MGRRECQNGQAGGEALNEGVPVKCCFRSRNFSEGMTQHYHLVSNVLLEVPDFLVLGHEFTSLRERGHRRFAKDD